MDDQAKKTGSTLQDMAGSMSQRLFTVKLARYPVHFAIDILGSETRHIAKNPLVSFARDTRTMALTVLTKNNELLNRQLRSSFQHQLSVIFLSERKNSIKVPRENKAIL